MASTATTILENIIASLRTSNLFAAVLATDDAKNSLVPRALVRMENCSTHSPDDNATARWQRLEARITIRTRSDDNHQALTRAVDLAVVAGKVLLADPYRGNRCEDLPIGRATEIGRIDTSRSLKRPDAEATFTVRCHYEQEIG